LVENGQIKAVSNYASVTTNLNLFFRFFRRLLIKVLFWAAGVRRCQVRFRLWPPSQESIRTDSSGSVVPVSISPTFHEQLLSTKSVLQNFYVLTILVCNLFGERKLAQKLFVKCMLVKLASGALISKRFVITGNGHTV